MSLPIPTFGGRPTTDLFGIPVTSFISRFPVTLRFKYASEANTRFSMIKEASCYAHPINTG